MGGAVAEAGPPKSARGSGWGGVALWRWWRWWEVGWWVGSAVERCRWGDARVGCLAWSQESQASQASQESRCPMAAGGTEWFVPA